MQHGKKRNHSGRMNQSIVLYNLYIADMQREREVLAVVFQVVLHVRGVSRILLWTYIATEGMQRKLSEDRWFDLPEMQLGNCWPTDEAMCTSPPKNNPARPSSVA